MFQLIRMTGKNTYASMNFRVGRDLGNHVLQSLLSIVGEPAFKLLKESGFERLLGVTLGILIQWVVMGWDWRQKSVFYESYSNLP